MRSALVIFAIVAVLLVGGGARLAYLESAQGDALRERAARQQFVVRAIPALRGEIVDWNGHVLAGTVRRPSLFVDPLLVTDARYAAHSIAPVVDMTPADLEAVLLDPPQPRFVWLARRVSDEQCEAYERVVRSRGLRAFGVRYEPTRVYPNGVVAPQVIGFVGIDLQGLAGVEQRFDELLGGTPGRRVSTVDVGRRRLRSSPDEFVPAEDGATIVLTIDTYIQQVTQDRLATAVEKHAADWGVAVVMDPQSGEILAMASEPSFDPADPIPPGYNDMSEDEREVVKARWRNRVIADSYEPGSIFKPFIASAALNEGIVKLDQTFSIDGPARRFGGRTIHDTHAYGKLAVHEIVSKSSNIGMGLIGDRVGNERMRDYVRRFGFGTLTEIDLPGEHMGQVQPRWTSFSTQSVPIGQEIAVTPVQVATAFSTLCNGGVLLKPRVVRGIIGPDGDTLQDNSNPLVVRQVLEPHVAREFRTEALVETVQTGTGKRAQLERWQVFGKTGTAQIAKPDGGGYLSGAYVGSFIGGAPADHPRVVALVSIYKPTKDGYYGGVVAAPVVKDIIAQTLEYMKVPPQRALPETPVAETASR